MTFVYIHNGTSGRYYIGSSQDVVGRLKQHNSGIVYSTNRIGLPLELITSREFETVSVARAVEAKLKRWKNPAKAIAFLKGPG